jgi:carbon-monoxide dehydrogenase large subunit
VTAVHAPTAGRFVGQAVPRKEDPRLLTGRGRYVDDVRLPGMLHAHFVRSDLARGRITRLDLAAAREAPGVVAVLTAEDLNPAAGPMLPTLFVGGALGRGAPLVPLAPGDVRFVGDPIAVVLAEDRYLAEDAAELVEVDYDPQLPIVDYETARDGAGAVHPGWEDNVAAQMEVPVDPGLQEIFDTAAHVVTETFHQHRYSAVPMETRGVVANWDPYREQLEVWLASQNPHEARLVFSRVTGLPENRVRVMIGDVGGGFGLKNFTGREEQVVVLASHHLGRPVKWSEDRREHLIASAHARIERVTAKMAVDSEGRFLAAHVDHLDDIGAYPIGGGSAGAMVALFFTGAYRVPRLAWKTASLFTNTCGRAAYRGPWQMETTAREQMVDVVARAIGMDPLELRRRNVVRRDELPYTMPGGMVLENVSPSETLEQAASAIDYAGFRQQQAAALAEGRLLGIGLSLYIEPQTGMGPFANEPAHVRVQPDGRVDVFLGSGAHGQGLETTTAQLVAEHLGVDIDDVTVHQGDTESTPFGPGTGGSRSGPMLGAAVQQAATEVRDKAFAIAAHLLEASPDDLTIEKGVISVAGSPQPSVTLGQVAAAAYLNAAALPAGIEPGLEVMVRYKAPAGMYSNACHACTVEVDRLTGAVTVIRYVVSEDCGVMINPNIVEGQIAGGVAQGIGGALFEHNVYDGEGNPMAATFLDYLLPTAGDIPDIEYHHVETPASTLGGYKGVGEGGAIGAPPAVFNAVADALAQVGARITDQPLTPVRVRTALSELEAT